jgi:hypothetical protein
MPDLKNAIIEIALKPESPPEKKDIMPFFAIFVESASATVGHKCRPANPHRSERVLMRDQTENTPKDVFDKGSAACKSTSSDIWLTEMGSVQ